MGKNAAARLAALGARLRAHREALQIPATTAAEAAGMSRVTLHRIERGEPSVTMGAYMSAIAALGLDLDFADAPAGRKRGGPALPRRIRVADYGQLKRITWQLGEVAELTPKEALACYERNWKHVDAAAMTEDERDLLRRLVDGLGGGHFLV
jgi:transcriptional regulator with XRE-family HTH domain